MYKHFLLILLIFLSKGVFADGDLKIGSLPNGLTYYIHKNAFPEQKASLRLLVKAGSLYESEEERGLAHFVEHMVFRGSENFCDGEVIRYLESLGAQFGHHTNAYTSFDRTVYFLEVPLEKEGALETGILILSDLAARAKFDQNLIDIERRVILDEYNSRVKTPEYRTTTKVIESIFGRSLYPERMPIGLPEIVKEADDLALRGFYETWYRPDRMAVVIVGDFDIDSVEAKVYECFNSIRSNGRGLDLPDCDSYPADERQILILQDPSQPYHVTSFLKYQNNETEDDVYAGLFHLILQKRFAHLSRGDNPPFLGANIQVGQALGGYDEVIYQCIAFEDKPLEGLKAIYDEIEKYIRFGASEEEFKRALLEQKELIDSAKANMNKVTHYAIADRYLAHFFHDHNRINLRAELDGWDNQLGEVTLKELNAWITNNVKVEDCHILVTTPKEDLVTKKEMQECLDHLQQKEVEKTEEIVFEDLYMEKGPKTGISISFDDTAHEYETIILENGLKVLLHPSKKVHEQVLVAYIGAHGKDLLDPSEYPSCNIVNQYMSLLGMGNLNHSQLYEYLRQNGVSLNACIQDYARFVVAEGNSSHLEDLFKLTKGFFLERKVDKNLFNTVVAHELEIEKTVFNRPEIIFQVASEGWIHSNHPFFTFHSAKEANFDSAMSCMEKCFASPLDFTLIVVGDFEKETVKSLLEEYCNFAVKQEIAETSVHYPDYVFPKTSDTFVLKKGKESPCINIVSFGSYKNINDLANYGSSVPALKHILQNRLLAKVRQKMGGTYSIHVDFQAVFLANNHKDLIAKIIYTSEPERADELSLLVKEEIKELLAHGVTQEEMEIAKEIRSQEIKTAHESNTGIIQGHLHQILYNEAFYTQEEEIEHALKEISKELILDLAQTIFKDAPCLHIKLLTE